MKTLRAKKAETAGGPASIVDWPEVNRVLDFMSQHGLEEFEYAQGDVRIHLRKPGPAPTPMMPAAAPPGAPAVPSAGDAQPAAGFPGAAASGGAAQGVERPAEESLHIVKSPIVGTFYGSPNPTAPPFVKAGDQISAGQVLCIVEAMKLMNEIESEVAGEVVRVLVESGQAVEYGQPMFAIRPAKSA